MGAILSRSGAGHVPKLYYGSTPAAVTMKTAENRNKVEMVPLSELLQLRCPSLFEPYWPAWWLNRCVQAFTGPGSGLALLLTPRA